MDAVLINKTEADMENSFQNILNDKIFCFFMYILFIDEDLQLSPCPQSSKVKERGRIYRVLKVKVYSLYKATQ